MQQLGIDPDGYLIERVGTEWVRQEHVNVYKNSSDKRAALKTHCRYCSSGSMFDS